MSVHRQCRRVFTQIASAFVAALVIAACAYPALSAAQTTPARNDEESTATPRRVTASIALVLPLTSGTYARASVAVRDGFLAAAAAANEHTLVIAHGDNDVETAFAQAREAGARVIVGPLVRDDVKAIAVMGVESPLVLALNQVDEGVTLPPNMFALTLGVESDARQLAKLARDTGARTAAVISVDTPLQRRFAAAFAETWMAQGGSAPVSLHFDRSPDALVLLKRELAKRPVDVALLAVDSADAVLVKPYVGTIATYAGSSVNDRQPRETLRELEDLRFVDIPWLANPDAREFASIPRPPLSSATLDRLYALGVDAFRVAQLFAEGRTDRIEFDGATGHLTLDATRQFTRESRALQFKSGLGGSGRITLSVRARHGAQAEALAALFLARHGLVIVERNWRRRVGELDLIALDGDVLVFVEVRLRRRGDFGGAAASITAAKRARMMAAAGLYLARLQQTPACRFDAILLDALDPARIQWLRDVVAA